MMKRMRSIISTVALGLALAVVGSMTFATGSVSAKASCESKNGYKYTRNEDEKCVKKKPIECVSGYIKSEKKCIKRNKVTGDGDCFNLKYRDDEGFKCNDNAKDMKACQKIGAHAVKGKHGDRRCIKKNGKTCTNKGEKNAKGQLEVTAKGKYSNVCVVPGGDKAAKL